MNAVGFDFPIARLPQGLTEKEILVRQDVLFSELLLNVPEDFVRAKAAVGKAPKITTHNNYGVTPAPQTRIQRNGDHIEFVTSDLKMRRVSARNYTDDRQVFPAERQAVFADVGAVLPKKKGYQCFVVADGCNWGPRPKKAAEVATETCLSYISKHIPKETTTRAVAAIGLEALKEAQKELVRLGTEQVGETTVTIGIIIDRRLVVISVGDAKVFLLRRVANQALQCYDVTHDSRATVDAKDCGGRLGPPRADWRNLQISVVPLEDEDIYVATSDGAHDNLNPQYLGTPRAAGFAEKEWNGTKEEHRKYCSEVMCRKMAELVGKNPENIGPTIIQDIVSLTAKTNDFMLGNPTKPMPSNYKEYPGKVDHVLVLDGVFNSKLGSWFSKQ